MTAVPPRPAAPDATAGDGLRDRAERIVANWRVNFDHDDDRPLVNMIEAALRDVLAAAAERDGRNPSVCPRCGNWCVYDGWGHVHGNGLGIGSCKDGGP